MIAVTQARHEATGWRGYLLTEAGTVQRRTLNLYPTAEKALEAVDRMHGMPATVPAPIYSEPRA
ncbi:MAG: hypothetical protein BGP10_15875 [Rhodanobacter sp. 68-29]|nr:hypothetical protein [Rhodanobacter sp.]ODV27875.1 MAG: hypothetical protein ABT19_01445 [Rhodanobacter sp. SCN 68-63]OJY61384.1 MAG: hypothetical protein BGP10_15875 [Rhodanobacter sp. 68-29]